MFRLLLIILLLGGCTCPKPEIVYRDRVVYREVPGQEVKTKRVLETPGVLGTPSGLLALFDKT